MCFQVSSLMPTKRASLERSLRSLRCHLAEVDELDFWLHSTKELLKSPRGQVISVTSADEKDSIVVDPKVSRSRRVAATAHVSNSTTDAERQLSFTGLLQGLENLECALILCFLRVR